MRVGAVAAAFLGGLGLALTVALGPGLVPAGAAPVEGCAAPMAESDVRVVVVVDPGDGGPTSVACLVVPRGTTGSQVLARRAAMLGAAAPRYGSSGLLCAIDGYPSSGCGERGGTGFRYWANFSGTSGDWRYGNYNPFTRRVADGDIEGWRFVEGVGNGTDPPPRVDPSPSLFPARSSAPPEPTSSVDPSVGATGSAAGASGTPSVGSSTVVADGVVVGGDAPVSSGDAARRSIAGDAVSVEVEGAPVVASTSSRPWVPVVVVALVVVALAGGAVVRSRTRP
ncbi:MAG: hypothetical protein FGM58_00920 [Acidimicrobiia bacterium]|nr:hypothetical protein [Acidimicrobiia bacterium]